ALVAAGGDGRAVDQHVVGGPAQVEPQRLHLALGTAEGQAHQPGDHAGEVEQQQEQVGLGDLGVEVAALDQAALGGDVELAQLGVDHRHGGGQQDVPGQGGLVDLVPQQAAVPSLHAQV